MLCTSETQIVSTKGRQTFQGQVICTEQGMDPRYLLKWLFQAIAHTIGLSHTFKTLREEFKLCTKFIAWPRISANLILLRKF